MNSIHRVDLNGIDTRPTRTTLPMNDAVASVIAPQELQKIFDFEKMDQEKKEKLEQELKKINQAIESYGKEIHFVYNEEAQQLYVEVVNSETKEVITSLPPEFLIDLSLKMKELVGLFIDKKL